MQCYRTVLEVWRAKQHTTDFVYNYSEWTDRSFAIRLSTTECHLARRRDVSFERLPSPLLLTSRDETVTFRALSSDRETHSPRQLVCLNSWGFGAEG